MKNINQVFKKNIIISGYYGNSNFGDDIILHVLVENLQVVAKNVCVISANPSETAKIYGTKSCYKFDLFSIILNIMKSDVLISGGGSLLQDVTSFSSLIYYLSIIFVALLTGKKVIIFAQGVGPIVNPLGRFLTKIILKKCSLVTVRDQKSYDLLKSWNIKPILVNDPAFGLKLPIKTPMNRIGINLRDWEKMDENFLFELARLVNEHFSHKEIFLFPFQNSFDTKICENFSTILRSLNNNIMVKILYNLETKEILNQFRNLDYVISMRFHGCLLAIKYGIRTLALSYDEKVEKLANAFEIPCVSTFETEKLAGAFEALKVIDKAKLENKVNETDFDFEKFYEFLKR